MSLETLNPKSNFFHFTYPIFNSLVVNISYKLRLFGFIANQSYRFVRSRKQDYQLFGILPGNREIADLLNFYDEHHVSKAKNELVKSHAIILWKKFLPSYKSWAAINPAFYKTPQFVGDFILSSSNNVTKWSKENGVDSFELRKGIRIFGKTARDLNKKYLSKMIDISTLRINREGEVFEK